MKNARHYEKLVRKLLGGMGKARSAPREDVAPLGVLVESILLADATVKQARQAMEAVEEEFVDFNELRAAPPKDIADCVGKDFPHGRDKAEMIVTVLNAIFARRCDILLDYMGEMTKRDLRRHLAEVGLDPFPAACLVMEVFSGHAIPVDETLLEVLEMNDLVGPGTDREDAQKFLERVIPQKLGPAAHLFFRDYIEKNRKKLEKKRKADAARRAAEEQAARKAAEAAAKAKAEREAKDRAAKKAKAAKASKKKRAAKKAARKTVKKAAGKKAAKKRPARKAARKTTSKKTRGKKRKAPSPRRTRR